MLAMVMVAASVAALPGGAGAQSDGGIEPPPVAPPQSAPPELPTPPTRPLVRDILPGSTPGREALEVLDAATLEKVAAQNGRSVEVLTELLRTDTSVQLTSDGIVTFHDTFDLSSPQETGQAPQAGPFPNGQTFLLHSRPGSNRVLYLDFDGYSLPSGTIWNGGAIYTALPWDNDGNVGSWSQTEHDMIQNMWQRAAEDFAPFDIDVTTEDPGSAAIRRDNVADDEYGTRMVITSSPSTDLCLCLGVSALGNIDNVGTDHDSHQPSWSFDNSGLSAGILEGIISHEAGHALGLLHDGLKPLIGNVTGYDFATDRFTLPAHGLAVNDLVRFSSVGGPTNGPDNFVIDQIYWVESTPTPDTFRLKSGENDPVIDASSPPAFGGTFTLRRHIEYYSGHGMWAPIMGNQDPQPVTTFSNGDYADSTNQEDDFAVVQSNGVGWVPDEAPGFVPSPTVDVAIGAQNLIGVTPVGDTDSWRYVAPCTGSYDIYVLPDPGVSPNLSIDFSIWEWGTVNFLANDIGQPTRVNADVATGMGAMITLNLVGGEPYNLWVQGLPNLTPSTGWSNYANKGLYEIVPITPGGCTPTNDHFLLAETIGGPDDTRTGNNTGFAPESGEPDPTCDFGSPTGPSAWWNWTAPSNGNFTIDTIGSSFDTVLAVYTGSAVDALTEVACDDQGGTSNTSLVAFQATAGTTYRIQVDGWNGQTGDIVLNTRKTPQIRPFGVVVAEGDSPGSTVANAVVFLETDIGVPATSPVPITVDWTTVDIPSNPLVAHPGSDYVAASGTLTIPAGQSQATVPITVLGDNVDEPPLLYGEWALLSFTNPSANSKIRQNFYGLGLVIIVDDDP